MDENYRNRHRAAWEQRRAAEAAEREAAAAAAAAVTPSGPEPSVNASLSQQTGEECCRSSAGLSVPTESLRQNSVLQPQQQTLARDRKPSPPLSNSPLAPPPSGAVSTAPEGPLESCTPQTDEEALSEAAARRLQAEFDAIDEVRQPDAAYQECLLGAPEIGPWGSEGPWAGPRGRPLGGPISEGFGLSGGLRAAAAAAQGLLQGAPFGAYQGVTQSADTSEPTDDAELARRLQEEEERRARRLRRELPSLRSDGSGPQGGRHGNRQENPEACPSIPVDEDPLELERKTPGESSGASRPQDSLSLEAPPAARALLRSASPDVIEIPSPHQPAPDVAAAAAAAGIQVDADEAVLQAAIAQSLVDM